MEHKMSKTAQSLSDLIVNSKLIKKVDNCNQRFKADVAAIPIVRNYSKIYNSITR